MLDEIVKEELTWEALAACRLNEDKELFFDKYEADVTDAVQVDQICLHCPVMRECGLQGSENKEWGVWGGVYLVNGIMDKNRNAHKTPEIWADIRRRYARS